MEDQLRRLKRRDENVGGGNGAETALPAAGPVADVTALAKPNATMSHRGIQPGNLDEAWRFGVALSKSSLIPDKYKNQPENCLIAIDLAARTGSNWLAVMQHLYIVYGRPSFDANFAIGLVNQSGEFAPIEYEVCGENPKDKDYKVRAYSKRKGSDAILYGPWIDWETVKAEGWDSKKDTKWKSGAAMVDQMFHYRAGAWWQKRHCPEMTLGMPTMEEAYDAGPRREVDATVLEGKPRGKFGFSQKEDEQAEDQTPPETQDPVDPPSVDESDIDPGDETDNLPDSEPDVEEEQTFVFHCNECEANFNDATVKKYRGKPTNFCKCGSRNLDSWEDWRAKQATEPEVSVDHPGAVWMCENGDTFPEPVDGACPECGSKAIEQLEPATA